MSYTLTIIGYHSPKNTSLHTIFTGSTHIVHIQTIEYSALLNSLGLICPRVRARNLRLYPLPYKELFKSENTALYSLLVTAYRIVFRAGDYNGVRNHYLHKIEAIEGH